MNWQKLGEIMKQMLISGCTDEDILKNRAYKKAQEIFADQINAVFERDGIKAVRKLEVEIMAYINWWIRAKREEVRKAGEDYRKINLDIVRERMVVQWRR